MLIIKKQFFDLIQSNCSQSRWLLLLQAALRLSAIFYGLAIWCRNLIFDLNLRRVYYLPTPVIGVGNLTVGGTGKTPLVIEIVRALSRLGLDSAVISRGYGGQAAQQKRKAATWVSLGNGPIVNAALAGDEPILLANSLSVPIVVSVDRFIAGKAVLTCCGPKVLVGDDLFQHRRLHRDFDIVALDTRAHLESYNLLPAGFLREPVTELRRALIVILTHANNPDIVKQYCTWLRSFWKKGPILTCRHQQIGLWEYKQGPLLPKVWQKKTVLAFCGLAKPDGFIQGLKELGLNVLDLKTFIDHHPYSLIEIKQLWDTARSLGVEALVTTEKDAMRLPSILPLGIKLWISRLRLIFDGGNQALEAALAWGLRTWERKQ